MFNLLKGITISIGMGGGTPTRIYDPIQGWMTLLLDADGKPIKDADDKYIYVKEE